MRNGEIWLVKFSPSMGDEINKTRPAVIVGSDDFGALRLRLIVPITEERRLLHDWHVKIKPTIINNLRKSSIVDCFQVHCFSEERFVRKIGKLTPKEIDDVKISLVKVLDLS
jgi:mRNA interferase MazF